MNSIRLEVRHAGEINDWEISGDRLRSTISDLLRVHGLPLNTRCAGRGCCRGCRIRLLDGVLVERGTGDRITPDETRWLKSCQLGLANQNAVIDIPMRSLNIAQPNIVSDFRLNLSIGHQPLCQDGEEADPGGSRLGAAVDIGTTTVVLMLVNMADGRVLARKSAFNRQVDFADNVVSRIELCMHDADMVARLQRAVIDDSIAPLLNESLADVEADRNDLRCITVSGNTTMLHLALGQDPTPMATIPFAPQFLASQATTLDAWPHVSVHTLPSCSAYIGADIVAGILAAGMAYRSETSLLVDVGTNGEIALMHEGTIAACATAAGPAFEGSGLTCGMRAAQGAISHIRLAHPLASSRPVVETIGDSAPVGICGSGYVDYLAEGRRRGLLTRLGRFETAFDNSLGLTGGSKWFEIATDADTEPIVISEADTAALLQAKAAIAAGIDCLLKRSAVRPEAVDRVFLAGGFGLHLNVDNAVSCGLLPGFSKDQIQSVGNTSLAGAYMALVDATIVDELAELAKRIDVVELNKDPGFESAFIDHMAIDTSVAGL